MKRLVTALAAGAAVSTIAFASASVLGVDGSTIQHGQDGVSCDTNGVNANWGLETDDNSVRSVRISEISSACIGDELFVKVNDRAVQKKVIAGPSESFTLSPQMTADEVGNVEIWIEG